jgi:pimeloyl-ACP methyl ester carboxylesterase
MSLTGWPLLTLVTVLTLAAFVALVVVWPGLSGRRPTRIAARAGLLLGVNLLVLVTAAVQLNNQFLFFAGWSDLAGALGGSTTTTGMQGGGAARKAAQAHVDGNGAAAEQILQPLPAGDRLGDGAVSYKVTGKASGITADIVVSEPPGYSDPKDARTRYPVLETFAGYPAQPVQWAKTMQLPEVMAEQVAAHKVRTALIVSPTVQIPAGVDTECVNGQPSDPQVETWLTQDVPDWVAAHFRIEGGRGSWATIGLSAGGWCAAMAAMLHPAQYSAAIVLGGYFKPDFGSFEPYPASSPLAHRYDLVGLASSEAPPIALWVETSHADPASYASSAALLKAARPPLSVTQEVLQNAGHRIGVWQGLLPKALAWLGTNVPGFSPQPGG